MSVQLPYSAAYKGLSDLAESSLRQGRRADLFTFDDVSRARLYSYAFRAHTIGSFFAVGKTLRSYMSADALTAAHLQRATEQLDDLANKGMDSVPDDFRAVISTFSTYDVGVKRVVDSLNKAVDSSRDSALVDIRQAFVTSIGAITRSGGIHLTQDKSPPALGSFIVPGLGITIVPLVYGDHHSWNLAYLSDEHRDVPNHLHHFGSEIHLGFEPLGGYMVLGDEKSFVREGYALPIPPGTRHGWISRGAAMHHVPFIFGSLKHAGWGIFADVVPQPIPFDKLVETDRDSWKMGAAVYLEREILAASRSSPSRRSVIIPASVTNRDGSGGLELAVSRVSWGGMHYLHDSFRIVSVVKGNGRVRIGSFEENLAPHDHFGIPSGLKAHVEQVGHEPLTLLDAVLRER